MKLPKFLTSRSTVITLLLAISVALLFASSVPQRSLGGKTPEWVGTLPESLQGITALLGLDNVVGSGWFAVLVALFWLSLTISTLSQYSATRALLRSLPSRTAPQESIRIDVSPDDFEPLVQAAGFRLAASGNEVRRYVKNRIGYWGNFLLHVGLVTAVFFTLIYVLTQHRVLMRLTGQEISRLSPGNVQEIRGVMSRQGKLPHTVVLKNLEPRFWGNDKLEYLSSELYFTEQPGGEPRRVDVALSDKSQYGPFLVYQANAYGRAFDLEFESARGETGQIRFYLPYPLRRDGAGYGEMVLPGTDFLLKGKFYADRERASMTLNQSPLTLRLFQGKALLGEATLPPNEKTPLGPLSVRLVQSQWWTDILLDGTRGIAGIFTGFALILAGVLSSFCMVPREIVVRESNGSLLVQLVARRFALFYREEFDEIIQKVAKTEDV